MMKTISVSLVLGILLAALGCNDSGSTPAGPSPPPVTTPAPPSTPAQAKIDVEVINAVAYVSGEGNALLIELRMTESGRVGANLNFIRVEIFRATGEFVERQELGASDIKEQSKTNRLEANSSRQDVWGLLFNATVKTGRTLKVTVGFTDDRGNDSSVVLPFVFQ